MNEGDENWPRENLLLKGEFALSADSMIQYYRKCVLLWHLREIGPLVTDPIGHVQKESDRTEDRERHHP